MKKSLFGYKASEVDIVIGTLREENESLNSTITTLNTQIKNSATNNNAKATLLEADLKKSEESSQLIKEEKEQLEAQITAFSEEVQALKQQNEELHSQVEDLHIKNEELKHQISEYDKQMKGLSAFSDELDTVAATTELQGAAANSSADAKEYKQTHVSSFINHYLNLKEELETTKTALETAADELKVTKAQLAKADSVMAEQSQQKASERKLLEDINHASEISLQAYHEMSRMRNDVIEHMQEQMKEYYQLVNDNSVKMRTAIEQQQADYNKIIREFFQKASEYRINLSNMGDEYSNMADYSINIDKISNRMNEIMNHFIEESSTNLKKGESALKRQEKPHKAEIADDKPVTEETTKKPIIFKLPGCK